MKNLIIWAITVLIVWIFPARWGAEFFFPELMAQFHSQVPWVMAWGALMFLLSFIVFVILGHDD